MNKITNEAGFSLHRVSMNRLKGYLRSSKRLFMAVLFTVACLQQAWAYDFTATAPSGHTLYFYISSSNTVNVVWPNSNANDIANIYDGYTEPTGNLVIPSSVTHNGTTYTVAGIGTAFANCEGLTSVTIPNTVIDIYQNAFRNCTGLTSVTIPNSVTTIGQSAFEGCRGLTSVTIPNSVTSIGTNAFHAVKNIVYSGTATGSPWGAVSVNGYIEGDFIYSDNTKTILTAYIGSSSNVSIPNTVTTIENLAFRDCSNLTSVTIPNSVTSIGFAAFYSCRNLTSITIPSSVSTIEDYAFEECSGLTSVNIPNGITFIGQGTFFNCSSLTSVNIPNTVTTIRDYAFSGCGGLTSVTIPNSVTTIGDHAFANCDSLTSVTIPNLLTAIGNYTFYGCNGLTSVTIGNSVTSIGEAAFAYCNNLTSVTIPNSVITIEDYAFHYCNNLASVTIPNSVSSIGTNAFYLVKNINYNGSATGSPWGALNVNGYVEGDFIYSDNTKTTLTAYIGSSSSVIIPNTVTTIGEWSFAYCMNLTSVTIPNSVITIEDYAFFNSQYITSIDIPNSVTTIGEYAFNLCHYLNSLTIGNSVTTIGRGAFASCYNLTSLTIPNSVTTIGRDAFASCYNLTSLTIPNSVTTIGKFAFSLCSGLTSITIPNSVTTIDSFAFYNCTALTSVTIPNSINTIKYASFHNCTGLTSVTIPNSVTTIEANAFEDCTALTSVSIPSSVTSIGDSAFVGCSSLDSLNFNAINCGDFPNNELHPFYNCPITTLTIGDSVQRIPAYFAYNRSSLTSVTIPNTVTFIGNYAFNGCSDLSEVISLATLPPTLGTGAFDGSAIAKVPCGSLSYYTSVTSNWSQYFATIEEMCDDTTITITVISVDENMGTVLGSGTYEYGSTATIAAIPQTGYQFYQWNDGNTSNPRSLVVSSDSSFIAMFSAISTGGVTHDTVFVDRYIYDTITNTVHDTTVITQIDTVVNTVHDTIINTVHDTIINTVHDTIINTVHDTVINTVHDTIINTVHDTVINTVHDTITITQYDTIINTVYDTITVSETYYTLDVTSTNSAYGIGAGSGSYPEGCVVTLVGLPMEGYRFVSWNDGNTDNPRQITISENASFVANFSTVGIEEAPEVQNLTVYPNPTNGVVTLSEYNVNKVEIYDAVGKKVREYISQRVLDMSDLSSGEYMLRITLPQGVAVRKVIRK